MRRLPDELLERHNCLVRFADEPKKERAYQQYLRLGQALWRVGQGLPEGGSARRRQGAWIPKSHGTHNFVSDAAWEAAQAALADAEKLVDHERLHTNLVSSQPLAFNLFGDLKVDLDLASRVLSRMIQRPIVVSGIEFEYSPGRGDLRFTCDRSAFDVYVEYTTGQERGFLGIEVKYQEDLTPRQPKNHYRPRYSEITADIGCFTEGAERRLKTPPLEQLWRDHLLACSLLLDQQSAFDEGSFVVLFPSINDSCRSAVVEYAELLSSTQTFCSWTLEFFVEALQAECDQPWVTHLKHRYLGFECIDRAWQDYYLEQTVKWATRAARADLWALQEKRAHSVQFRPTSTGVTMVGLLPGRPQLGRSYTDLERLADTFDSEFEQHCVAAPPGRLTPEKELQSFLIRDAQQHGGQMQALNAIADTDFVFITDEIAIPGKDGDGRLDLLAVRDLGGYPRPAVIELKSVRAMKELLRQTHAYRDFVERHLHRLSELASATLGRDVRLGSPVETWVVWPAAHGTRDPRRDEFRGHGVGLIGYIRDANGFEFVAG